jgi:hypothetical protein
MPVHLPAELVEQILSYLQPPDLARFGAVSVQSYEYAANLLWKDLLLTDRKSYLSIHESHRPQWPLNHEGENYNEDASQRIEDHHDDTPMIQKLIVLVEKPHIAAKVRTLTHTCCLPGPDMFNELGITSFRAQSLSSDWRTLQLLRLAIRNLVNVHTIRLFHPHYNIGRIILDDFFFPNRPQNRPIARLWLENCDIWSDHLYATDGSHDLSQLKSLRVRRIRAHYVPSDRINTVLQYSLARRGRQIERLDGAGDSFLTWHHTPEQEAYERCNTETDQLSLPSKWNPYSCPASRALDAAIYLNFPNVELILQANTYILDNLPSRFDFFSQKVHHDLLSVTFESNDYHLIHMLQNQCSSLTHLNIDWVVAAFSDHKHHDEKQRQCWMLSTLSHLTFPHLKSFQFRNAVGLEGRIPYGLWLLQPTKFAQHGNLVVDFVSFFERHPNIISLSWPLEHFIPYDHFSYAGAFEEKTLTSRKWVHDHLPKVIEQLGSKLETLRVEARFSRLGEPQSANSMPPSMIGLMNSFIQNFVVKMTKVKTMKMEVRVIIWPITGRLV